MIAVTALLFVIVVNRLTFRHSDSQMYRHFPLVPIPEFGNHQTYVEIDSHQCDQMTRLCFQYLAIYSSQSELKTLPKAKLTLNKLPQIFKYWPKWWNFTKSGHTGSHQYLPHNDKNISGWSLMKLLQT